MFFTPKHFLWVCLLAIAFGGMKAARGEKMSPAAPEPAQPDQLPAYLQDIGITEHDNAQLPLDAVFVDDHGNTVRLGDYFTPQRPVVLQLGYFGCPMLCGLMSHGIISSARELNFKAGTDYEFVFMSVHPAETPTLAAAKKQSYLDEYGRRDEANGFHFLVGQQRDVRRLADAVGFRFKMISSTREIAHPAVLFVATPDGHVSRYLYGVQFPPRTLRLSLVEAAAGKIGTTIDRILLFCYHYDATTGGYVMGAVNTMRLGGVLTMLGLGSGIFWLSRKEGRRAPRSADSPGEANNESGRTTTDEASEG